MLTRRSSRTRKRAAELNVMCKNNKFIQSIIVFSMAIYAVNLRADNYEEEFLKHQEEHVSYVYCENEEVLNCLNIKYSSCKSNIKAGNVKCTSTKLLAYYNPEIGDIKKNSNQIKKEYAKYAVCLSNNFKEQLNIPDSTFNSCEPLMVKTIEDRRSKEMKE